MPFYTKKPIPVEVRELTLDQADAIAEWSSGTLTRRPDGTVIGMMVFTLEGSMTCILGDYVVKGPFGEFWFVKKQIFESTYEEVRDEDDEDFIGPNEIKVMNIQDMHDGSAWIDFSMGKEVLQNFAKIGIIKVLIDASQEILDKENVKNDRND